MKYKTTKREVLNGYSTVISVNFGELQNLLTGLNPVAYTCGTYGWDADIYDIDGVAIVTGYRPFGRVESNYGIDQRYDAGAQKVLRDIDGQYVVPVLRRMLNEYIDETLTGKGKKR